MRVILEEIIIEDPPSISSQLEYILEDMKDSLVRSITAHSFLDILGKDREQFEMGYSEYVNNVRKIEAYICQYVEVCVHFELEISMIVDRWLMRTKAKLTIT